MPALIAVSLFGSFVLFAFWYARSKNQMEARVRELSTQRRAIVEADDPFGQRVMFPIIHSLSTGLLRYLPTSLVSRARTWLTIADSSMSLASFMAIVLVTSTAFPAGYFVLLWYGTNGHPDGRALALTAVIALLGFLIPMLLLRRRAKNRQDRFSKALPDSLDLLTTCVEAGLSLDFAFQRVSDRQRGPVGDEFNRMLREKALGQTRGEALRSMAERIDLPDVNVFINSVIQAETLGTSIAQVLRIQARQLRIRRRQRAEQVARQAAPKMVFPLVFCIMPSLFIVMLGPIIINAIQKIQS